VNKNYKYLREVNSKEWSVVSKLMSPLTKRADPTTYTGPFYGWPPLSFLLFMAHSIPFHDGFQIIRINEALISGKDFALLSNCNHTITTHGTFGHWASILSGGEIYTEYGAIVPDAYN